MANTLIMTIIHYTMRKCSWLNVSVIVVRVLKIYLKYLFIDFIFQSTKY